MQQMGDSIVAKSFYLAQLQACKGSCKCKSCELLRKAADHMTEETLNPTPGNPGGIEDAMATLKEAGYDMTGIHGPGGA